MWLLVLDFADSPGAQLGAPSSWSRWQAKRRCCSSKRDASAQHGSKPLAKLGSQEFAACSQHWGQSQSCKKECAQLATNTLALLVANSHVWRGPQISSMVGRKLNDWNTWLVVCRWGGETYIRRSGLANTWKSTTQFSQQKSKAQPTISCVLQEQNAKDKEQDGWSTKIISRTTSLNDVFCCSRGAFWMKASPFRPCQWQKLNYMPSSHVHPCSWSLWLWCLQHIQYTQVCMLRLL